jgi:hypothetical protein
MATDSAPTGRHDTGALRGQKRCLYVIGMHRSGTSAVTGLITMLGLRGPAENDLIHPGPGNKRGTKESRTLTDFNESILVSLGGGWSAPPLLEPHWEKAPAVVDRRARATKLMAATFGSQPFVWKDPRNCLLLPFWRTEIAPPDAAVFVYRNPLEVARSLQARNGFPITHGLALWERYVRSAAVHVAGIPTLVVGFERVLGETGAWCGELVEFFDAVGLPADRGSLDRAGQSLASALRHQRLSASPSNGIHASQRSVFDALERMQGAHLPWSSPDLGDEPDWVEDVLTMRRELVRLQRQQQPSMAPWARAGRRVKRVSRRSKQ